MPINPDQSLTCVRTLEDLESQRLEDIERIKEEMKISSPACPTEQMSLLLARLTLNSTFQFVGLLDCEGRGLVPTFTALKAVKGLPSDFLGKPFWEDLWWQGLPNVQEALKDSVRRAAQGEFIRYDTECLIGEHLEQKIILDFNMHSVRDRDGNVAFLVVEGRDVTEQRHLEREVSRQKEELAQLDRLKTQFFANISHEFRTPLTLMLGPTEEALSELEAAEVQTQRERLETVQRNALRLLRMVNQLLDFSAIEANRIQASFQPTELSKLTKELASMFQSAVEKAGLRLIVNCLPLTEPAYVDRDMWEKIVLNLLSNAFKHTFQGEIEVGMHESDHQIQLRVRDTGVGIPSEQLPKIFDRFQRIPESRSRTHEGSGIGLALVQELVKLHGGTISVESVLDQGSTFLVTIPAGKVHLPPEQVRLTAEPETPPMQAKPFIEEASSWLPQRHYVKQAVAEESDESWYKTADGVRVRVLLADDNTDMRDYIERLLTPYCDVESVMDGEEALAAARRNLPDLVLSDIMMPKMDGLQLLAAIRSDDTLKTIPVVLVSARAGEGAKVEGLRLGADDYLIKPFDRRELLARVKANLNLELHRITKEAREAKKRSEARFRRLVDSNIIGVFSGRIQDGMIIEANDYVLEMLGYTLEELRDGKLNWRLLTPLDQLSKDDPRIFEIMEKGVLHPFEKQYFHKDGHRVDVLLGVVMMDDSADDFICYVLDISDRKNAEMQLAEYTQRLKQSNKELEQFATVASHDLQEPLRKVLLFTDHLRKVVGSSLSLEAVDDLERIQRSADRMQRLITDLLDLSRVIRRGQPFRKIDLRSIAEESVAELSYTFSDVRKRVTLNGAISIDADANQMRQMILQLLDNALKFHQANKPSSVWVDIQQAHPNLCQISVADDGIGIKAAYFDRIFDVFTRLHGVEYPGTGIGLALVKKIVERHRGQIEVQSELGKGSTFIITLPVSA